MSRPVEAVSRYVERVQPFRVRMVCGHVETRMMREATAGVAFDPAAEWQVQAPYARCAACSGGGR